MSLLKKILLGIGLSLGGLLLVSAQKTPSTPPLAAHKTTNSVLALPVTGRQAAAAAARAAAVPAVTQAQPPSSAPSLNRPGPAAAAPLAAAPTEPVASLAPEQWKSWPVLPRLPAELKALYRRGLAQGNDPRAFSILGDCQSQPEVFMGIFDSPQYDQALPLPLQETVANFRGSFNRYSPTVKDATTEGALLWVLWNDNKEKKCTGAESPLDCELRTHKPSIVFVHIGTHWEARNRHYLEIILNKILDQGAIPILVTKADNREKDERVNKNLASLASQYHLPLWNFWASVQHLPDNGLKPGSDMYLNEEATAIHRLGALQALDTIWRSMRE